MKHETVQVATFERPLYKWAFKLKGSNSKSSPITSHHACSTHYYPRLYKKVVQTILKVSELFLVCDWKRNLTKHATRDW